MIQILKTQGWLVVAAALTIGLSACTSEEFVNGGQLQADGAKKLTITVGAGFADDASTRSAVVYDKTAKTRTLTFTEGDRLFVKGYAGESHDYMYYDYMFYGMLNLVEGSISEDGKSAKFTGDLTLLTPKEDNGMYEYEKNANAISELEGKDPLSMSTNLEAHLVHQDAVEDKDFVIEIMEPINMLWNIGFSYYQDLASDVNTLMTTMIDVGKDAYDEDGYDAENKKIVLANNSGPIFECAISGFEPNTSYKLNYSWMEFETAIKADASGKATFAFFADRYNPTHVLKFEPLTADGEVDADGEVLQVDLGEKELDNMTVYNITKTATTETGGDSGASGLENPVDGGNW